VDVWNSVQATTCPFITLDRKLKETAKKLQTWSDRKVGHVRSQLALAKEILHRLEMAQDGRILSPAEFWLKNKLKKQSLLLSSFKHTMARLRARISWLRDGDANTKLFHLHARQRKRKNFVARLVDGNQILTNHIGKAECIDLFYTNLLGTSEPSERSIRLSPATSPKFYPLK
jgi:hypothetical protein